MNDVNYLLLLVSKVRNCNLVNAKHSASRWQHSSLITFKNCPNFKATGRTLFIGNKKKRVPLWTYMLPFFFFTNHYNAWVCNIKALSFREITNLQNTSSIFLCEMCSADIIFIWKLHFRTYREKYWYFIHLVCLLTKPKSQEQVKEPCILVHLQYYQKSNYLQLKVLHWYGSILLVHTWWETEIETIDNCLQFSLHFDNFSVISNLVKLWKTIQRSLINKQVLLLTTWKTAV